MFTQPMSTPPAGPQTASPPVSSPPSRPSRLRGLSYLRSYTHNHLLSRDGHHGTSSAINPNPATTGSHPATGITTTISAGGHTTTTTSSGSTSPGLNNLTRSASYTPSSTANPAATLPPPHSTTGTGLTLVNSSPDHPPTTTAAQTPAEQPAMTRTRAVSTGTGEASASAAAAAASASDATPSIRFSAYYDPRSPRPSLSFPPISRTLPSGGEVIRVGRYSERDGQNIGHLIANQPSAAPVGFKSKVVSRRHCEFWCEQGKWFIRDVKSSSGTFLNHIRLSPPSQDSKAFPINDGDIIQLGIDFKGGEEMIFRCVKMRVELNRGWQNKPNTFNMAAHKRLRTMNTNAGAAPAGGAAANSSQDCSICLNSIAPCQSLFVAPCSHTWHFKCVRSLLTSHQYPIFICPNCRAGADLEADVEEPTEDWEQFDEKDEGSAENAPDDGAATPPPEATPPDHDGSLHDTDAMDMTVAVNGNAVNGDSPAVRMPHSSTEPLPITNPATGAGRASLSNRTPSPPQPGTEGPITPRNDAGPWVFDGSAGRRATDATEEMTSLDAAADMDVTHSDSSSR